MLRDNLLRAAGVLNLLFVATVGIAPTAQASNLVSSTLPNSAIQKATTMSGLPVGYTVPSTAIVAKDLQNTSGWSICVGSCASGAVPKSYNMTQHVASASLNGDGTGATFYEGGTAYGDVMWHKTVSKTPAQHFVMDMYIKIDHPENVQALEFAMLKRDGTYWYKGSTQCNYKTGVLRAYNTSTHSWQSLGASCVKATANTWQRITIQYSIVGGHTNFEAVSFNNAFQQMSGSLPPQKESTTSSTLGVHFQLDNANTTSGYKVSIDNWNIYSW